jgi:hypothetical protein
MVRSRVKSKVRSEGRSKVRSRVRNRVRSGVRSEVRSDVRRTISSEEESDEQDGGRSEDAGERNEEQRGVRCEKQGENVRDESVRLKWKILKLQCKLKRDVPRIDTHTLREGWWMGTRCDLEFATSIKTSYCSSVTGTSLYEDSFCVKSKHAHKRTCT